MCVSMYLHTYTGIHAGKESACNAEDLALIPEMERYPGEGKDYPLLYSGLENSMDCISPRSHKESDMNTYFHRYSFSPIDRHVSILPQTPLPSRLAYNIE